MGVIHSCFCIRSKDCMMDLCLVSKVNIPREADLLLYSQTIFWWRRIGFSPLSLSHKASMSSQKTQWQLEIFAGKFCFNSFSESWQSCFQGLRFDSINLKTSINQGKALIFLDYTREIQRLALLEKLDLLTWTFVTSNLKIFILYQRWAYYD